MFILVPLVTGVYALCAVALTIYEWVTAKEFGTLLVTAFILSFSSLVFCIISSCNVIGVAPTIVAFSVGLLCILAAGLTVIAMKKE